MPTKQDFLFIQLIYQDHFTLKYRAQHKQSNLLVILQVIKIRLNDKIYSKSLILSSKFYQTIRKSVEIHYHCSHKHIQELYGYFQDDQFLYHVMEDVQNDDLYQATMQRKDSSKVAKYFLQIVSCLIYLSKRDIHINNLRLENFALDHEDNVKLFNFSDISLNSNFKSSKKLGVLLYELYFQKSPFLEETLVQSLKVKQIKYDGEIDDELKNLMNQLFLEEVDLEDILESNWVKNLMK